MRYLLKTPQSDDNGVCVTLSHKYESHMNGGYFYFTLSKFRLVDTYTELEEFIKTNFAEFSITPHVMELTTEIYGRTITLSTRLQMIQMKFTT